MKLTKKPLPDIVKGWIESVNNKLMAENWDGTDKHAESILSETVAPVLCLKVYNEHIKK